VSDEDSRELEGLLHHAIRGKLARFRVVGSLVAVEGGS
jgi:hypothetical protein